MNYLDGVAAAGAAAPVPVAAGVSLFAGAGVAGAVAAGSVGFMDAVAALLSSPDFAAPVPPFACSFSARKSVR